MTNTGDWDRAALEKRVDEPDTTTAGTPLPPPNRSLIGYHYDDKPVRWWLLAIVVVILAAFAVAWLATARPAAAHVTTTAGTVGGTTIAPVTLGGTATWYCSSSSACTRGYGPSDLVAAIDPTLGIAKGERLTVNHAGRSVVVRVVDVCACKGRRLIDLTSGAFRRLAPLSAGVIDVTIELGGSVAFLPPTDTR